MDALLELLKARQAEQTDWQFWAPRGIDPNTGNAWMSGRRSIGLDGVRMLRRAFEGDAEVMTALEGYVWAEPEAANGKRGTGPLKNGTSRVKPARTK